MGKDLKFNKLEQYPIINKVIASRILTIGENFTPPKGGIASVLTTYNKHFEVFKSVATYDPNIGKFSNLFFFIKNIFVLIKTLFTDRQIKIVHIHGAHYGSFYRKLIVLIIAKSLFGKKIIYHSHGSDFHIFYNESGSLIKNAITYFFKRIDLLICLSVQWKSFFESNFEIREIIILENIVDELKSKTERTITTPLTVLFLGYIGDRKGIFDLLDVIKDNTKLFDDKLILKIGGNGDVTKLREYIKENQLQAIVQFEGWIADEKKHQLLSEANLFVLPSYNEGLPISILEAMSYGIPVLSTKVGGIPEILRHGINGFLINPGDKNDLLKYLRLSITNPNILDELASKTAQYVQPYYATAVIPKLQAIYQKLLY